MRRTRFDHWACPIARTTDLIGDWWTPLVMRQAFMGNRRFDQFQEALGVSRAVLTERLNRLVEEEMLVRHRYQERPPRDEYRLTDKGRAFWPVLAAMWRWGQDWLPDEGDPVLVDRRSGEVVAPLVVDERTGEALDVRRLSVRTRDTASSSG